MSDTIPGRRSYFKVIYKLLSPAKLFLVTGKKKGEGSLLALKTSHFGQVGLANF